MAKCPENSLLQKLRCADPYMAVELNGNAKCGNTATCECVAAQKGHVWQTIQAFAHAAIEKSHTHIYMCIIYVCVCMHVYIIYVLYM